MDVVQALFVNAAISTLDEAHPNARCLLSTDGVIDKVLDERPTGLSQQTRIVDCQGGWLVPGFHDCHMHLTASGLLAGEHDVSDCRDIASLLRRIASLAKDESLVYAGNFQEQSVAEGRFPTQRELDEAGGGKPVLLTRIDGHSCVVNSAALALITVDLGDPGVDRDALGQPTGRLRASANYTAQGEFVRALPGPRLRQADREAAQIALAAGITTLHNVIEGDASYEELSEIYIDNAVLPLHVIPKSCTTDVPKAKRLGGKIFGGDIFVDGSIGSRTAALESAYADGSTTGLLYLTKDNLIELFSEAAEAGLSPGVHAIGDLAIEQAIAAWEVVAVKRGSLRGLRPSIDHFEIARPDHLKRAARIGLLLSMQPAFDVYWGGDGGMYEQRLGTERARSMNLTGTGRRLGCTVCAGSDSPVTKLSALLGIQGLVHHHVVEERLSVEEALRCYTSDAARLSFNERRCGRLIPGMAADFTVLEKQLDDIPPENIRDTRVLMTVVDGQIRYHAA